METNDYIKIFSGSFVVVKLLLSQLEEVGITAIVKDEGESARLAGFGPPLSFGFQEVFVSKEEASIAFPIVERINATIKTQNP